MRPTSRFIPHRSRLTPWIFRPTNVVDHVIFQLLQHLADTLPQVFTAHASQLARVHPLRAALTPVHDLSDPAAAPDPASVPLAPPQSSPAAARLARQRRTRRWADYPQVWGYYPTFPERPPRHSCDRSMLDPDKAVLLAGWNRGCRKGWHLFRTIRRHLLARRVLLAA